MGQCLEKTMGSHPPLGSNAEPNCNSTQANVPDSILNLAMDLQTYFFATREIVSDINYLVVPEDITNAEWQHCMIKGEGLWEVMMSVLYITESFFTGTFDCQGFSLQNA